MSRGTRYAIDVGANAVVGGLTAGIARRRKGESFWRGFTRGAAGGGLAFAGKQISARRFHGAGAAGRQVAAVGSSVVNNATAGRPVLSRLVLPLGPFRVYAEPEARRVRAKVDLASVVAIGYAATRPGARLDMSSTLSAGAPVFFVSPEWGHRAGQIAGVVLVDGAARDPANVSEALAHERVHVSQYDFASVAWGEPLERWITSEIPATRPLHRYVDFGTSALFLGVLNLAVPQQAKPWEHEAYLLSSSR